MGRSSRMSISGLPIETTNAAAAAEAAEHSENKVPRVSGSRHTEAHVTQWRPLRLEHWKKLLGTSKPTTGSIQLRLGRSRHQQLWNKKCVCVWFLLKSAFALSFQTNVRAIFRHIFTRRCRRLRHLAERKWWHKWGWWWWWWWRWSMVCICLCLCVPYVNVAHSLNTRKAKVLTYYRMHTHTHTHSTAIHSLTDPLTLTKWTNER